MQKIRFIESNTEYMVSLKMKNNRIVCIFKDKEDASSAPLSEGFVELNEHNDIEQSDYSEYKYIYKQGADEITYILTNNEDDIYVEPEIPEIVPSEPYIPTEEELKTIFKNNKTRKIEESKKLLADYLESHPITSNCHNGVDAQYSVTAEKQSLMANNYLTYTIAKESGLDATLSWNATGAECEEWKEEEFIALVLQISEYVKPFVSLQQSYEVQIRNCETQEDLDSIVIAYDETCVVKWRNK